MENAYIIQEQNGFHSVIILQIYNNKSDYGKRLYYPGTKWVS